jgi:hypothetical protein
VLCLAYQYSDEAANAAVGSCTANATDGRNWLQSKCEPSRFLVTEKYYGSTSFEQCKAHID